MFGKGSRKVVAQQLGPPCRFFFFFMGSFYMFPSVLAGCFLFLLGVRAWMLQSWSGETPYDLRCEKPRNPLFQPL